MKTRPGTKADLEWALALAGELPSFGLPPWRDRAVFLDDSRARLRATLTGDNPDGTVLIAGLIAGERLGFVHLVVRRDANTGRDAVHLDEVVVDPAYQGTGVGTFLLTESERWARERGAVSMVLAVFQDNVGARRLYTRFGFRDDVVRAVKQLETPETGHP